MSIAQTMYMIRIALERFVPKCCTNRYSQLQISCTNIESKESWIIRVLQCASLITFAKSLSRAIRISPQSIKNSWDSVTKCKFRAYFGLSGRFFQDRHSSKGLPGVDGKTPCKQELGYR